MWQTLTRTYLSLHNGVVCCHLVRRPRKLVAALLFLDLAAWSVILPVALVQTVRTWRKLQGKHCRHKHIHAIHISTVLCAAARLPFDALRLSTDLRGNAYLDTPVQRVLFSLACIMILPSLYIFLLKYAIACPCLLRS